MVTKKRKQVKRRNKRRSYRRGGMGPDELIKGKRYIVLTNKGKLFKGDYNQTTATQDETNENQLIFSNIETSRGDKYGHHTLPQSFVEGVFSGEKQNDNVAYGIGYYNYINTYWTRHRNGEFRTDPIQTYKYEPIIVSKGITKDALDMFIVSYKPYNSADSNSKLGAYININDLYVLPNIRDLDPLYWILIKGCRFVEDNEIILESPLIYKNVTNNLVITKPIPYTNPDEIISEYNLVKQSGATSIEQDFLNKNMNKLTQINEKYPGLFKIPEVVEIGRMNQKYGVQNVTIPIFVSKDANNIYMARIKMLVTNIIQNEFNNNGLFFDLDKINTLPNFKETDIGALKRKLTQLGDGPLKFIKDGKILNDSGIMEGY